MLPCVLKRVPATASANAKNHGGTGNRRWRRIPHANDPVDIRPTDNAAARRVKARAEPPATRVQPFSQRKAGVCIPQPRRATPARSQNPRPSALKQTCDTGLSWFSGWVSASPELRVPNPGRSIQRRGRHAAAIRLKTAFCTVRACCNSPMGFPVRTSQMRAVLSLEAETTRLTVGTELRPLHMVKVLEPISHWFARLSVHTRSDFLEAVTIHRAIRTATYHVNPMFNRKPSMLALFRKLVQLVDWHEELTPHNEM